MVDNALFSPGTAFLWQQPGAEYRQLDGSQLRLFGSADAQHMLLAASRRLFTCRVGQQVKPALHGACLSPNTPPNYFGAAQPVTGIIAADTSFKNCPSLSRLMDKTGGLSDDEQEIWLASVIAHEARHLQQLQQCFGWIWSKEQILSEESCRVFHHAAERDARVVQMLALVELGASPKLQEIFIGLTSRDAAEQQFLRRMFTALQRLQHVGADHPERLRVLQHCHQALYPKDLQAWYDKKFDQQIMPSYGNKSLAPDWQKHLTLDGVAYIIQPIMASGKKITCLPRLG